MKRLVLTLVLVCCAVLTVAAQDTIFKTDAQSIQARIIEVSPSEVRYKRFSNPDGPTYVLPVADISHIIYQNGERDDFNATDAAVQPSAPQPAAQPAARPEVGGIYDDNGVRGMVIWLDESGMHGVMLSLEESAEPRFVSWSAIRSALPQTLAGDKNDGRTNMESVARYIDANGLSWDDFPAFKWCRDLGEGWYLPSIDELLMLGSTFNGGQRMKFDRRARQQFNNRMKGAGGAKVDPMVNYYSSTYSGDGRAATSTMEVNPPYVQPCKIHERYLVRAVRRF